MLDLGFGVLRVFMSDIRIEHKVPIEVVTFNTKFKPFEGIDLRTKRCGDLQGRGRHLVGLGVMNFFLSAQIPGNISMRLLDRCLQASLSGDDRYYVVIAAIDIDPDHQPPEPNIHEQIRRQLGIKPVLGDHKSVKASSRAELYDLRRDFQSEHNLLLYDPRDSLRGYPEAGEGRIVIESWCPRSIPREFNPYIVRFDQAPALEFAVTTENRLAS